ncbi:hypothetical protein G7Y89_g3304 [Cudoniella acicularis]|uniref:Uncharacterized protein n=1 Tax=Cudoniella acicularis TaxID=354080 RepID=A0A8H4RTN6_9HELO|nr:hypothetical protein G7Y89_g3304 [Cudoniella acicularis]
MGVAAGIDEGLISGTLSKTHFVHLLGLDKMGTIELANLKGNISAMVRIGCVGARLFSVTVSDVSGLPDSFASFGFSASSYFLPMALQVVLAGLVIVLSFFNYESPGYLVKIGQDYKAKTNLACIRNLPIDD